MHELSICTLLALAASNGDAIRDRDLFGQCVAPAGALDWDRIPDLWVGDPTQLMGEDRRSGRVWLVSGNTGEVLRRIEAPASTDGCGRSLTSLDDVDGDGRRDVAIGCLRTEDDSDHGGGCVLVHVGATSALAFIVRGPADRAWRNTAEGPPLAALDDWSGDGVPDFAIGWSFASTSEPACGRVDVVSGRDGTLVRSWTGPQAFDRFGRTLATLPDLDGDGRLDLAVASVPENGTPWPHRPGFVRILSSKGGEIRVLRPRDGSSRFGLSLLVSEQEGDAPILYVGQPDDPRRRTSITSWNLASGEFIRGYERPRLAAWGGQPARMLPVGLDTVLSFGSTLFLVPDRDGDACMDVLATAPDGFSTLPAGILSSCTGAPLAPVSTVRVFDEAPNSGIGACVVGDIDRDKIDDFVITSTTVKAGGYMYPGRVTWVSGKSLRVIRTTFRPPPK